MPQHLIAAGTPGSYEVGFLFLGGQHQMLHIAPVAAALAEASDGRCVARVFVGSLSDERALSAILASLGLRVPIERLRLPWPLELVAPTRLSTAQLKAPRLVSNLRTLRSVDALVVAERTSTVLKRLPGRCPPLIHIPHGAGDRAKGFERRIKLFDYVIVAGPKDRDRMIKEGLVTPDRCFVSGYIKLGAIRKLRSSQNVPRLFGDDRPIVLYNPHFSPELSSWRSFSRPLVQAVLNETDANLIIAPHVRLRSSLDQEDHRWLEDLQSNPRVLIDLGSPRSSDMTYTMAADVYVGDVSSQVYEFIHRPRACVFLNATDSDQEGNPDFAFWRFGEVVNDPHLFGTAIARAIDRLGEFAEVQRSGALEALGSPDSDPGYRAARIISGIVSKVGQSVDLL